MRNRIAFLKSETLLSIQSQNLGCQIGATWVYNLLILNINVSFFQKLYTVLVSLLDKHVSGIK